jgi:hypothetical protein
MAATRTRQIVSHRETRTIIRESIVRKTILTTLAVLTIGGAATGILIANAQPAPPPPGQDAPSGRPHWMGWMQRGGEARRGEAMQRLRTFALVYRQEDRNLTPPDVQKIAEAFLLWNGNHTWKVVEVAPTADGAIGFALATQEGSVIARLTMDPHTGRVTRTG